MKGSRHALDKTKAVNYTDGIRGYHSGFTPYFATRPFAALASPLPPVPRRPPRAAPPLPAGAPRLGPPAIRDGAGVENFGAGFEDVGGFSTKDVSVVLQLSANDAPLYLECIQEGSFSVNLSAKPV